MKRNALLLVASAALAGLIAYSAAASGRRDDEAAPIYGVKIPAGYRDWKLIAVTNLMSGSQGQLRAILGNDIVVKAAREGKLPFPDGSIIAALHWGRASSEENNKVFTSAGTGTQS